MTSNILTPSTRVFRIWLIATLLWATLYGSLLWIGWSRPVFDAVFGIAAASVFYWDKIVPAVDLFAGLIGLFGLLIVLPNYLGIPADWLVLAILQVVAIAIPSVAILVYLLVTSATLRLFGDLQARRELVFVWRLGTVWCCGVVIYLGVNILLDTARDLEAADVAQVSAHFIGVTAFVGVLPSLIALTVVDAVSRSWSGASAARDQLQANTPKPH